MRSSRAVAAKSSGFAGALAAAEPYAATGVSGRAGPRNRGREGLEMAAIAEGGHDSSREFNELAALYQATDGLYRARSRDEALAAVLDGIVAALGSRASILLFDREGVMRFVAWRGLSERYRAGLEGHSPWRQGDTDAEPILVRDIEQSAEPDWIKTAILSEGIRALAFVPIMSSRKVIGKFMTYYPDAHDFSDSEVRVALAIARQLGFSLERGQAETARRAAEGELRESEERFRLMSELAPVMIWTSDAQGRCLHLNRLLREFWGTGDDLSKFDWQTTMHPDDAPHIGAVMMKAVSEQAETTVEGRYRRYDGAWRTLLTEARPRFAADGTFLGMIGVNVDVTVSRESEMALRGSEERLRLALDQEHRSAERLEVMVEELQHRTRNLIAVVQSIADQTFKNSGSLEVFRRSFSERLGALSRVQGLLSRSSLQPITIDALVGLELAALNADGRVTISGPPVPIGKAAVQTMALALHELATNARKHGALAVPKGRIAVTWDTVSVPEGDRSLVLQWLETGIGRTNGDATEPGQGYGRTLIEKALTYSLGARTSFDLSDGALRCTIELPLKTTGAP
jgi:PAS domain S-box-containing protein